MKRKLSLAVAALLAATFILAIPVQGLCAGVTTTSVEMDKMVSTFMVKATKYYDNYGFSNNRYKYTDKELRMLATVIYLEARGEPYKTKIAIGNVVMNRVISPGYPGSTIAEVVTRPNQFCYSSSTVPNAECIKAARDILDYETWTVPQNTYFFRATTSTSNWGRHKYYARIGHTVFYTDSYAGRTNISAVPQKLFQRAYKWPQYGCAVAKRVKKVQVMLNALGFKTTADGYFGTETKAALIAFQKKYGLVQDGIAGPATLRKLITKYGTSKYLKL